MRCRITTLVIDTCEVKSVVEVGQGNAVLVCDCEIEGDVELVLYRTRSDRQVDLSIALYEQLQVC